MHRLDRPRLDRPRCILAAVVGFAAVCGSVRANDAAPLVFTDVSAQAGIGSAATNTESLAWGDFDNDGDQDLYLTQDAPNILLRNDGVGNFADVSAAAGVDHPGFSVGTAFGDLDNDGDLDLYVVSFGSGPDVLYRNDGPASGYTFTDVTVAAGITETSSSRGAPQELLPWQEHVAFAGGSPRFSTPGLLSQSPDSSWAASANASRAASPRSRLCSSSARSRLASAS